MDRARACSALTLPFIVPPQGSTPATDLPTPYQSDGARGVNNISSRLLLTQFPPNAAFARLELDPGMAEQVEGLSADATNEVNISLAGIMASVLYEIETTSFRPVAFEVYRNLVVAGNALFEWRPKMSPRVFGLERYMVVRDGEANPVKIIIREMAHKSAFTPLLQTVIEFNKDSEEAELFTLYERQDDKSWKVRQEAGGKPVGPPKDIKEEDLPVMPLRMNRVQGEDYGRGLVEEVIGDLYSLEGLSTALVQGAAAAARLIFCVNPNGSTRIQRLGSAPNGGFVPGSAEDVTVLQLQKSQDFNFALQTANGIRERLSRSFLLNGPMRDAERVTAEEIRAMAQELENTLGGTYSLLSQEFQLPLVKLMLRRLAADGRAPELPKGLVNPRVITGIEALGRGSNLLKHRMFLADATATLGPEQTAKYLKPGGFLTTLAALYGIDPEPMVRTDEEVAAQDQQAMANQMVQSLGPNVIDAVSSQAQAQ